MDPKYLDKPAWLDRPHPKSPPTKRAQYDRSKKLATSEMACNKRSSATEPGGDPKRRKTDDTQQAPAGIEKVVEDVKKEARALISALKEDLEAEKQMHLTVYIRATDKEEKHYQALEKVVDLVSQAADKMVAVIGRRVAVLEREIAVHERELAVHKREMVEIREALNLKKRSDLDSPFDV